MVLTLTLANLSIGILVNAQPFLKKHPAINPYNYEVVKEASFSKAAVTSAHPLASMVAMLLTQPLQHSFHLLWFFQALVILEAAVSCWQEKQMAN